jgi:RNase P subunit RPR2
MKTIKRGANLFPKEHTCESCKSILLVEQNDLYRKESERRLESLYVFYICSECGYENKTDLYNSGFYGKKVLLELKTIKEKHDEKNKCHAVNGMFARCLHNVVDGYKYCARHQSKGTVDY